MSAYGKLQRSMTGASEGPQWAVSDYDARGWQWDAASRPMTAFARCADKGPWPATTKSSLSNGIHSKFGHLQDRFA